MKKGFWVVAFLLAFIPSVLAQGIDVFVSPDKLTAYAYKPVYYQAVVVNNNPDAAGLTIKITGPHPEWIAPADLFVKLEAGQAKTYSLNFYPTGLDRGIFDYKIIVESYDGFTDSADISLAVSDPVIVKDFKAEFTNELMVTAVLDSVVKQDLELVFDVLNFEGVDVATLTVKLDDVEGENGISRQIILPKTLPAGIYKVKLNVFGENIANTNAEQSFELPVIHNVIEKVQKVSTPLYDFYTVIVENSGNVVEDYTTYKSVSSNLVMGFLTRPRDCRVEGGSTICQYTVSGLKPGEQKQISYRVEYWPLLIPYSIVGVIIIVIAVASFRTVTKPTINKRYSKKSGNAYSMILQIKNPFYYNLENVILRDWISMLASVLPEEFDSVKPVIKRSDAGTELVWNLGNVKPNEERIITYKIRPVVEGTGLKMPEASMRYTDNKGRTGKINSNEIVLE